MRNPDLANDYVLGSLSPTERREVERLRQFNPALDAAITRLEAQMAPLTAMAGEVSPPPGLFDRIMQGIGRQDDALAATYRLPFEAGMWEPYSDGVDRKYLWDRNTFFLRCVPGAVIPPHGHDEDEHLVVVSGDLLINGVRFGVGDYHTMARDTRHDDARTVGGCILLIQLREAA